MGDYLKSGEKIGTCGNAYYATLPMLQTLQSDEEAAYYCNPKNGCAFAFPFPQYDGKEVGQISNFHEGERVDFYFDMPATFKSYHKEISFHIHPKSASGVNMFVECPHNGGKVSHNFDKSQVTFRLIGQRYYEGNLCITAECVYCGAVNIFSLEESEAICAWIESRKHDTIKEKEYYMKISKRIKDTYTVLV